jgi:hypothetical protein
MSFIEWSRKQSIMVRICIAMYALFFGGITLCAIMAEGSPFTFMAYFLLFFMGLAAGIFFVWYIMFPLDETFK